MPIIKERRKGSFVSALRERNSSVVLTMAPPVRKSVGFEKRGLPVYPEALRSWGMRLRYWTGNTSFTQRSTRRVFSFAAHMPSTVTSFIVDRGWRAPKSTSFRMG